jgi:hypothetical protein
MAYFGTHTVANPDSVLIVLKEEVTTSMQLLGITSLKEASLEYLNTSQLEMLLPSTTTFKKSDRAGSKL